MWYIFGNMSQFPRRCLKSAPITMDLNSAQRVCRIRPTVLHGAHSRNVTLHIECAVVCTCAADKARKLSCPTLHYPMILQREIKTKLRNFKTTKYFVCPCMMYAHYVQYGGIRKSRRKIRKMRRYTRSNVKPSLRLIRP